MAKWKTERMRQGARGGDPSNNGCCIPAGNPQSKSTLQMVGFPSTILCAETPLDSAEYDDGPKRRSPRTAASNSASIGWRVATIDRPWSDSAKKGPTQARHGRRSVTNYMKCGPWACCFEFNR